MDMARQSKEALGPTLQQILERRGWSYRDLAEATAAADPAGRGLGRSYLNLLANGKPIAKPEAMKETIELLAAALGKGIEPTYFREYRELRAAEEAARLTREVGLDKVLAALAKLEK